MPKPMPAVSRRRFQRIKVGEQVTIEVLETGVTITKLEITAPQGWRILRNERKIRNGQTMLRSAEELEEAAAKKLGITREELAQKSPSQRADILNPEKPTKLIVNRKQFEGVRVGPDIYIQLFRAGTTCRIGIEKPARMAIQTLDMSEERKVTESHRRRDAAKRRGEWVANGGPERLHHRKEQRKAA